MITIFTLPALVDNYAYVIINSETKHAVAIDVPEAVPILGLLSTHGAKLTTVLLTHHHWDHVDGLPNLAGQSFETYGAGVDAHRLPKLDHELHAGNSYQIEGMTVNVIDAPGHTIGHIAFHLPEQNALFSGDSLMTWGCGRLFEGTPSHMQSCFDSFANLPEHTQIYSGHNYGEANASFVQSLGLNNPADMARLEKIRTQNKLKQPVVPVSLAEEKETNPYFRIDDQDYANRLGIGHMTRRERFAHIRHLRDNF